MTILRNDPPAVTDEQLLAAHLAGDHAAFAGLVSRHERELYRFLRRFVGEAAADDVFQESLLQVHRSAHRFDPDQSFRPWLFTIAANKARDLLRARRRRRVLSSDTPTGRDGTTTLIDAIASPDTGPAARAVAAEMRRRVIAVVDVLPPGHREVLRLAYFHQLPYRQISHELGVPLGTVKSRLHVAVKAFAGLWGRGRIEGDPRRN